MTCSNANVERDSSFRIHCEDMRRDCKGELTESEEDEEERDVDG